MQVGSVCNWTRARKEREVSGHWETPPNEGGTRRGAILKSPQVLEVRGNKVKRRSCLRLEREENAEK